MLTTDGVHGVLRPEQIRALATRAGPAGQQRRSSGPRWKRANQDNVTALVMGVLGLDRCGCRTRCCRRADAGAAAHAPGDVLDSWTITALVADTGVHQLHQARDPAGRELVAIKTLHESRASDRERAMLARGPSWACR